MSEDVPILSDEQRALAVSIAREVIALPSAGRASLIKERSGGDTQVETEVASLLAAMQEMHEAGFLDDPAKLPESLLDPELDTAEISPGDPVAKPAPSSSGARDAAVGERIGEYTIKNVIGSGGMGTVYLAQQDNPRRPVALKVMNRGIASRSALRRFEFESQTLGRLRHPHIAQVYEAGTHDDGAGGVPYFAMEYIPNARTLTEYAANKQLGIRERLSLFSKVCDAVHHGHQKGIIHRDLKPGNILVDSNGEPKIIDFGVARATDSDMAVTTLQTDVGQLIGTLQYMSPEQCDADPHDLDTRSDVYALGVVLYEVLTAELPYDLGRVAIHEAARMIREENPTRPSTINRVLRGDIETITLKAMEKDRERRYQSAADMGNDIARYLDNQPIAARRPSLGYQLGKFARRHRVTVTAVVLVLLTLLAATIVSLTFGFYATDQKEQAVAANTKLDQTNLELSDALDESRENEYRASWNAYVAGIGAAAASLQQSQPQVALQYLDSCPKEFRAFEWAYLRCQIGRGDTAFEVNTSNRVSTLLSANRHLLATAGSSDVEVWDMNTERVMAVLPREGRERATSITLSRDGSKIIITTRRGVAELWDVATETIEHTLVHFQYEDDGSSEAQVDDAVFTVDGLQVATAGSDGRIKLWDVASGTLVRTFADRKDGIASIAISPDGSRFITGTSRGGVAVWDLESGTIERSWKEQAGRVYSVAFSPSGELMATGGFDAVIKVRNVSSGSLVGQFVGHHGLVSVVQFVSETVIASCGSDESIRLWNLTTGDSLATMFGHQGSVNHIAIDHESKQIYSIGRDRQVKLWPLDAAGHTDSSPYQIRSVSLSPDGESLAIARTNSELEIRRSTSLDHPTMASQHGSTWCMAWSDDSSWLACGYDSGEIEILDTATGETKLRWKGHEQYVRVLVYDAKRRTLISGAIDGELKVWNPETGELLASVQAHQRELVSLAISPSSDRIATGSLDWSIKVWQLESLTLEHHYSNTSGGPNALLFLDSSTLLATSGTGTRQYDLDIDGDVFDSMDWNTWGLVSLTASGDGQRIFGGDNRRIHVWDRRTGELLLTIDGHQGAVRHLMYDRSHDRLISASAYPANTIRVWDASLAD